MIALYGFNLENYKKSIIGQLLVGGIMYKDGLKNEFTRMVIVSTVICLVLFTVFAVFFSYLMTEARESELRQLEVETTEYKSRLVKQMDTTMQILSTLSKAYEISDIELTEEFLEESLKATNKANDFISMAFFDKNGNGMINSLEYGTGKDFSIEDCHQYSADAIRRALTGENTVSRMFDSKIHDEKIFVYAVPVYRNGEITGVLAAGNNLEIFTDVANGSTVMGGSGYLHLISKDGTFLIRSKNTPVDAGVLDIFSGDYLSEKTKQATIDALSAGNSVTGEFSADGKGYLFYVEPMGLNDWFLFCAGTMFEASSIDAGFIAITLGLLLSVITVTVAMLLIGYRIFRKKSFSLYRIACFDRLTGAENTFQFDENFKNTERSGAGYSVVALNIHNFKYVNDLFGRASGDRVLCFVADAVSDQLKEGEFFCRDAADLFYILLRETDTEVLKKRVESIISFVRNSSLTSGGYRYDLLLYSGIAVKGDRDKALIAMQSIRNLQYDNIAFYNNAHHDQVRRKNSIESCMNIGLTNREFKLFLQPEFDLKTNRMVRAEALVRWQRPDGKFMYPGDFIPLFEQNGFCLKLDMYMIERACEQIREWIDNGIEPLPISVNQSKLLFLDLNYPENLAKTLEKYGVSPSLITVEILEGTATEDLDFFRHQVQAVRDRGIRVSMDDFGSGYSSLNMLWSLNIDEIKLDKGFLQNVTGAEWERRTVIVRHIVKAASELGVATVAEGIETDENRKAMCAIGCDIGQGYFYQKPVSAAEFSEKYMSPR